MSSNNSGSSKSSSNNYPTIVEWFTKNDPVFVSIDGFIINIEDKPRASKDENSISTLENDDDDDDDGESLLSLKRSQDSLNSLSEASTWRRCRTCHCTFETKEEHRGHFSTPWHLYNVKAVSKGESPLTQEEYDTKMLSEMGNGSVSTKPCTDEFSDNNSSSSGDDDDPAYKDASSDGDGDGESEDDEDVEDIEEEIPGRTPMVIFADKKGEQIVVWRCVLEAIAGVKKLVTLGNEAGVRSTCQAFVRNIRGSGGAPAARCAVFLCRSGYFAGAVFDGRTLVAHKTFRRYTCRRKQGKSQSNYDAKGKQPHSAGAAKRRYHERRYVEEVNEVVTSWAKELAAAACPLVLVSAPKVQRAGKLLLFDGSPLTEASDVRVRKVPFPTRHPSLAVAESIHRMTFAAVPPSALETQQHQEQQQEEGEGESGSVTCENGGMSKSDVVKEVTVSLLVNASRLPEIATFKTLLEQLSKSGKPKKEQRAILSAVLAPVCAAGNLACAEALIGGGATHSHVAEDTGMTPLHYAARSGNYELVQLLLKSGASKGVKDGAGKVPAEYAVNDKVKELLSVAKPKKAGKKNKNKKKKKQQQRCVSVYDIEDSSDEEDEDEEQDGKGKGKKKVVQKKQEKEKKEKEKKEEKKKEELPPPPPRVFVDPVTCVICGKQEERKKSFMNSGKRFCSMDCVRKFLNN